MSTLNPTLSTTARYDVPAFVAELDALATSGLSPAELARAAKARLPRLIATPDVLASEFREPDETAYRSHIVAVAPSGAFSLVALVWLPGQATAIHDHICWCVVGILEGEEEEERFHLLAGPDGDRWLCPCGSERMTSMETAILLPPEENIHRVHNAGETLAISLHVYGADLRLAPNHSSINERFDDLPIRTGASGTAVPWRRQG